MLCLIRRATSSIVALGKPLLSNKLVFNPCSSISYSLTKKWRKPGTLKTGKRYKYASPKKLSSTKTSKIQGAKTHKGLLKRIKIVGPRWNRQFKFRSCGRRHLLLRKGKKNLRRKRRDRYISVADLGRVRKLLPFHKNKKFKDLN